MAVQVENKLFDIDPRSVEAGYYSFGGLKIRTTLAWNREHTTRYLLEERMSRAVIEDRQLNSRLVEGVSRKSIVNAANRKGNILALKSNIDEVREVLEACQDRLRPTNSHTLGLYVETDKGFNLVYDTKEIGLWGTFPPRFEVHRVTKNTEEYVDEIIKEAEVEQNS
jgi:hypothetical protein